MRNRRLIRRWALIMAIFLALSFYPLKMGAQVFGEMARNGTVEKETYPKYVIPYTPIAVSLLLGALLMPLALKRRGGFAALSALAIGVFFSVELYLEKNVVVTSREVEAKLADWQMFLCVALPQDGSRYFFRPETPVEILIGAYNPAFKLHFYMISVVLILILLNCAHGFERQSAGGSRRCLRTLILQTVFAFLLLELCVLACFTAFWRDGSLRVSPLSAFLMCAFFIILGITAGVYLGAFLRGRRALLSVGLPAAMAALATGLMYAGEMILLHGQLYILGGGRFFESLPGIVLSPADVLVIALSGAVTAAIFAALNRAEGESACL